MTDEIPDLPGYVSTKEAAKMLGISERRIRFYIEAKRLPAVRAADVLMIPLEHVQNFQRKIVGRPRKNTLAWRISSIENTQIHDLYLCADEDSSKRTAAGTDCSREI